MDCYDEGAMMAKLPKDISIEKVGTIDFALVPVSQYVELLEIKHAWDMTRPGSLRLERRSRSPIDRNPALAQFLAERVNKMELGEAHADCVKAFGEQVTPSISAIQRYWHRLRVANAIQQQVTP